MDDIYRTHYNVLSLTRSPLNNLMWAHYAENHKGYVIGFDVNQSFFTSKETCTIPIQFGSVIYTRKKPDSSLLTGNTVSDWKYDFPVYETENEEFLQRLFLYKSIEWAYEEEVRVVKMLGEMGLYRGNDDPLNIELREHFEKTEKDGSTRFKLKVPPSAIKEIYFGVNNNDKNMVNEVCKNFQSTKKYKCVTANYAWNLDTKELDS